MIIRFLVSLFFLLIVSCSTSNFYDQEPDLALTWSNAQVVIPPLGETEPIITKMGSSEMEERLSLSPFGKKFPILVYMHGCTGIGNKDLLVHLAKSGFIVVAPNSFARKWRPLQCDPKSMTGGFNLFVYDFRLAEIAYALDRLWLESWADYERLVLMGNSEGGVAAALYRGDEFRGRVIAQWNCSGAPHVEGIFSPLDEPILALIGKNDPWYIRNKDHGCEKYLLGRENSKSIIVEGDSNNGHQIFSTTENLVIVSSFLKGLVKEVF